MRTEVTIKNPPDIESQKSGLLLGSDPLDDVRKPRVPPAPTMISPTPKTPTGWTETLTIAMEPTPRHRLRRHRREGLIHPTMAPHDLRPAHAI